MKLSSFIYFANFGIKTILFKKKEPILGTIIVTDKCNLKCKHCSVNNVTAIIHPYSQIRKEMQQLYDMGIRILFFCGGETFLWKDGTRCLRDLVIEAKEMGFLIVNVVTNGTFPLDLPEADLILLSIDGDREHHNAIRGNTYDIIMENIKNATFDNICFYMAINQINKIRCKMFVLPHAILKMSVRFLLTFIHRILIQKNWLFPKKKKQTAVKSLKK